MTRGSNLADLSLCCYSPDWLWEETQLLGLIMRRGLLEVNKYGDLKMVYAENRKVDLVKSGTFSEDRQIYEFKVKR